jgi:hypothetical protein
MTLSQPPRIASPLPATRADDSLAILEQALAAADSRPRPGYRLRVLAHTGLHWREPRLLRWLERNLPPTGLVCTEGAAYGPLSPRERLGELLEHIRASLAPVATLGGSAPDTARLAELWALAGGEPPLTAEDLKRLLVAFAAYPDTDSLLADPGFVRALAKDIEQTGFDWYSAVNRPELARPALGLAVSAAECFALLNPRARLYGIEDPRHYAHHLELGRRGETVRADFARVAALRSRVLLENCIRAMDETASPVACAYLTGFHRAHFILAAPERGLALEVTEVTALED